MYGPEQAINTERYYKSRVLPKLLDENTEMFRFNSCKFNLEPSKRSAARAVFSSGQFEIFNCFTLEASMYGYIDKDRHTVEFTRNKYQEMGCMIGTTLQ